MFTEPASDVPEVSGVFELVISTRATPTGRVSMPDAGRGVSQQTAVIVAQVGAEGGRAGQHALGAHALHRDVGDDDVLDELSPAQAELTVGAGSVVDGPLETVNGGITVRMGRADWTGDLSFSTVNGGITVYLPSDFSAEIEAQTVRWIAEFIGYPAECGGLLVSGGNMANFVGFLAARAAKAGKEPHDQLHSMDYLVYAYLQVARDKEARAVMEEMVRLYDYLEE